MDSVVDGGAQGQRKIYSYKKKKKKKKKLNKTYQNQTRKNEAADFPRFIVIESLEEDCLVIFFIEKVISMRATMKTVKKTRNENLQVEVDSQRETESILKMKTFHTTKCRAYPHEKRPRELSGVGSWHWLQKRR